MWGPALVPIWIPITCLYSYTLPLKIIKKLSIKKFKHSMRVALENLTYDLATFTASEKYAHLL